MTARRSSPGAKQQTRGAALGVIAADGLETPQQLAVTQTLARRIGLGQPSLDLAQLAVAIQHEFNGRAVGIRGVLGDMRNLPADRDYDLARVCVQIAEQERKEARLAAAVGADQPRLLARIDGERGPFQQEVGTTAETQVFQLQHVNSILRI